MARVDGKSIGDYGGNQVFRSSVGQISCIINEKSPMHANGLIRTSNNQRRKSQGDSCELKCIQSVPPRKQTLGAGEYPNAWFQLKNVLASVIGPIRPT